MNKKRLFDKLSKLSNNNTSGSNEILLELNHLLIKNYDSIEFTPELFNNLRQSYPTFEVINKYILTIESLSNKNDRDEILKYFKKIEAGINKSLNKIFNNLVPFLKNNLSIITISNSNTVFNILKKISLKFSLKEIIVSESRPQYEGRILAERLNEQNINVQLITESQISQYVHKCDLGLIGADAILKNGDAVNKVGSKLLAINCKHYNKPFYVVAESSKFREDSKFTQTKKSNNEIWENAPKNIKIQNLYFEKIEEDLISKIITD